MRRWRERGLRACEVLEVFEEDLDAGKLVGNGLVELVGEGVQPGAAEGHGCYGWFVGHCCVLLWSMYA